MKLFNILTLVISTMISLNVHSADDSGKHSIRGAGLIDCQTFLKEQAKKSPAYLMMGGWIDGYITGVNQYATENYDVASFESTELYVELIKTHCTSHPEDRLYPLVRSIIANRWASRITKQSQLVSIKLGDSKTQLYSETVQRIQQRLTDKGFYQEPISGEFNAATITALASFQKTIEGYEGTGFPDQATLWALFSK